MCDLISLAPSMLFISDEQWQDEAIKDRFLDNLLEVLSEVNYFKKHKIMWTERLEEILWASPQYNPWLSIHDYRNSVIPILYTYLNSNTQFIDSSLGQCSSDPELTISIANEDIIYEYQGMYDNSIQSNIDFIFYHNCVNCSINQIEFSSSVGVTYAPLVINGIAQYFMELNISEILWPVSVDDNALEKFRKAIDIFRAIHFEELTIIYSYSLSKTFIKSLIHQEASTRDNILFKIVKRLCYNSAAARLDGQLQDEWVVQSGQSRFRVTPRPRSTRIHYNIVNNDFIFLKYYGIGEHDNGL